MRHFNFMHGRARTTSIFLSFAATLVAVLGIASCSSSTPPRLDNIARNTPPSGGASTVVTNTLPPPPQPRQPVPAPAYPSNPTHPPSTSPAPVQPSPPQPQPQSQSQPQAADIFGANNTAVFPPVGPAVMLGIDVLEADGFRAIAGKRIGLLSHPAGVNRYGVSTLDVLRRAKNVKIVALFGPEHGFYGNAPASQNITDAIDKKTGLPIYSLFGKNNRPTKEQLKNIDALVIDLQDIGVRSYTFSVCMKYAIEACFANNVEVIVLDRPNPLGGLKVDGPMLDRALFSGVGQFQVPYVHGLTMGELARMVASTPGALNIPEAVRVKGRLTVISMRGWRRAMRWPETGLKFVPTSTNIRDFPACVGYAMTGLGCQIGGFKHGIGSQYPFRGLSYAGRPVDELLRTLIALKLPGLNFRKVALTFPNNSPAGVGIYVDVTDWDDWRPTELSFQLMRLACVYDTKTPAKNPFAIAKPADQDLFNRHTGSYAFWTALKRDGARVDVAGFLRTWQRDALAFQQASRKFWLYN